jgi:hypothetical protein
MARLGERLARLVYRQGDADADHDPASLGQTSTGATTGQQAPGGSAPSPSANGDAAASAAATATAAAAAGTPLSANAATPPSSSAPAASSASAASSSLSSSSLAMPPPPAAPGPRAQLLDPTSNEFGVASRCVQFAEAFSALPELHLREKPVWKHQHLPIATPVCDVLAQCGALSIMSHIVLQDASLGKRAGAGVDGPPGGTQNSDFFSVFFFFFKFFFSKKHPPHNKTLYQNLPPQHCPVPFPARPALRRRRHS